MSARLYVVVLTLFLVGCVGARAVHGQDAAWDIARYDVDLVVDTSGTYAVTEAITFDLRQGTFTQGERRIPTEQMDALRDVEVTSAQVAITDVSTRTQSGERVIQWQYPERDTTTTFTLTYVVEGVPYTDNGRTVIDWQAVGDAWNVPIRAMQATVQLPFPSVPRDSVQVEPAADAALDSTATGWQATFVYNNLDPNEGYRLRIHLPRVIDAPERTSSDPEWPKVFTVVGLGLLGLLGGGTATWWFGHTPTPRVRRPREPDMPLPEAGYLLMRADWAGWQRLFSAMIFDLAERGHLTLRRVPKESSWTDTTSEKIEVKVHAQSHTLSEREEALIEALRPHDTLSDFFQKTASFRNEQITQLRDALVDRGWMVEHPARSWGSGLGGLMLLGGGVAALIGLSGWVAVVGAGLGFGAGLAGLLVAVQYRTFSDEGARKRAEVQAFLDRERTAIESELDQDPVSAADRFVEMLPWLALDTEVDSAYVKAINKALETHPEAVTLPLWIEDRVGKGETEEVLTSFLPIYIIMMSSTSTSSAGGAATVGSVSAGAGAVGGAGGGGGGVS